MRSPPATALTYLFFHQAGPLSITRSSSFPTLMLNRLPNDFPSSKQMALTRLFSFPMECDALTSKRPRSKSKHHFVTAVSLVRNPSKNKKMAPNIWDEMEKVPKYHDSEESKHSHTTHHIGDENGQKGPSPSPRAFRGAAAD